MTRPHLSRGLLSIASASANSIGKWIVTLTLLLVVSTCTEARTPVSPIDLPLSAITQTITHTLLTSGTNATNQSVYTTASIAPAANALITVAVLGRRSTGVQTPTVTGGGMSTWTLVASVDYDPISGPLSRVCVFRAMSSAPGSGALTITYPNSQSNATWIVSQWTGVEVSGTNGSGAIVQSSSARGDVVTSLSTTLAALADPNDVAYGVVGASLNGPAVTPGNGFTEIAEPTSGENTLLEAEWGVNLTTVSASLSAAKNAGLLGIEIKAGGAGGGVSASQSTVSASPTSVVAGDGSSTITVTAKDANGNPVSGATVVLAATGNGNTITQPAGPTNSSGVATGNLSSTVAEAKIVSATAGGTAITQTATVTVTSGSSSAISHMLLTSGTDATNQNVYTTASIAPAANALITVAVLGRRSTGAQTPTVTGAGMSWTLVASVDYDVISTPLSRIAVFRAMSSSPGSGPLTITYPNSQSNATWIVSQWSGVDTSGTNGGGAIAQVNSTRGDAVSSLSLTLSSFAASTDVAYGVVGAALNGPAVTPGNGLTEIAEPTSGESNVLEAEWGVGQTAVSASLTAAKNAGLLGLEIRAATVTTVFPSTAPDSTPANFYDETNLVSIPQRLDGVLFVKDAIEVLFPPSVTAAQRQAAITSVQGTVVGGIRLGPTDGIYLVKVPHDDTNQRAFAAVSSLEATASIAAMPSMLIPEPLAYRRPNDGSGWQRGDWRLNPDSAFGTNRANWGPEAIAAPMAWGCNTGDTLTRIGVLDVGLHRITDLQGNFGDSSALDLPNEQSLFPHGTYVTSVLAARGDNGAGMAGTMWQANLRPFDIALLNANGQPIVSANGTPEVDAGKVTAGITALANADARVINLSLANHYAGSTQKTPQSDTIMANAASVMKSALTNFAPGKQPLLVIAAGNNNGIDAYWSVFPNVKDSLPNQTLIVAAAGTAMGTLWSGSSSGSLVDVAAPGQNVGALGPQGPAQLDGTSLAAPAVSGLAGLLFSFDPRLTAQQVRQMIIDGAQHGGRMAGQYGLINAYESLKIAGQGSGAPLCGNHVWVSGNALVVERNPVTHTTETLANLGESAGYANARHGGHRVEVQTPSRVRAFELRQGSWVETPDTATSPYGGTFLSVVAYSHGVDSTVSFRQIPALNTAPFEVNIFDFYSQIERSIDTVVAPLTHFTQFVCIRLVDEQCDLSAGTGADERVSAAIAFPPIGGRILLSVTYFVTRDVGLGDWQACPTPPGGGASQCRTISYQERSERAALWSVDIQNGRDSLLWNFPDQVFWFGVSEDGAQVVSGEGMRNTAWTEQPKLDGSGFENVYSDPGTISNCAVHYRGSTAVSDIAPAITTPDACTSLGGEGTIAPIRQWSP